MNASPAAAPLRCDVGLAALHRRVMTMRHAQSQRQAPGHQQDRAEGGGVRLQGSSPASRLWWTDMPVRDRRQSSRALRPPTEMATRKGADITDARARAEIMPYWSAVRRRRPMKNSEAPVPYAKHGETAWPHPTRMEGERNGVPHDAEDNP